MSKVDYRAATGSPGMYRNFATERVIFGRPVSEALAEEIDRLGRERVMAVTNRSLVASGAMGPISASLGHRHVGTYDGVTAHVPRECIIKGAAMARAAAADLLLAIGGGSVIDAAKVMLLCLRHEITDAAALDAYSAISGIEPSVRPPDADSWIRMIAVPTTFSAAEYTWFGGVTDTRDG